MCLKLVLLLEWEFALSGAGYSGGQKSSFPIFMEALVDEMLMRLLIFPRSEDN